MLRNNPAEVPRGSYGAIKAIVCFRSDIKVVVVSL